MLQDAERKYWTIKLSVEKVEEEDFLDDIGRGEPDFTYVLSYERPSGGRHAVYVQSCSQNTLRCINSWGSYQPNKKISLNKNGNVFYRIFCTTFIVLSSTGPSAEFCDGVLGVFEYLEQYNNSPAYRQRHSVAGTGPQYLYRHDGGDWRVGPELGGSDSYSSDLLNRTRGDSVPTNNWLYAADEDGEEWEVDPEMTVTTSLPSVCGVITISLHGAAATAQSETGGEYRATGDWSAGRPVFSNGVTYLSVRPWKNAWWVTDSPDSLLARLQSGCVTWCPASPRTAIRHSDNQRSWRYEDKYNWLDGDIRLTCDTHKR